MFLQKPKDDQKRTIKYHIDKMNELLRIGPFKHGIICEYYAPKDTNNIQEGER